MKRRHLLHFILALLAVAYAAASAKAANPSIAADVTSVTDRTHTKNLHVDLDAGFATNLREEKSSEADRSSSFEMILRRDFSKHLGLSASTGLQQTYSGQMKADLFNTVVALNIKNFSVNPDVHAALALRATLPTEEASREEKSLRAGFSLRPTLVFNGTFMHRPAQSRLYLDLLQNVHRYETDHLGKANTQYRARLYAEASVALDSRQLWWASALGYYDAGHTYKGALRTGYGLGQEISRDLKNQFSVYAQHSISGNALAANGRDLNVEVFDGTGSSFGLGIRKSF